MDTKTWTGVTVKAEGEGVVEAIFARFNEIDKDGDVTLPGAFGNQDVKLCAWGHNWGTLPVGKGGISERGNEAVFAGQFFLETDHGKQTFLTVKGLAEQQEWSYGFEVVKATFGEFEGREVRFLEQMKVFEVSPVMRGAGNNTATTRIKDASGLTYAEHTAQVVKDVAAFIERSKARRDHRATEDRALSPADRDALAGLMQSARDVADDIKELLSSTEPPEKALGLGLLIQRTLHEAERRSRAA